MAKNTTRRSTASTKTARSERWQRLNQAALIFRGIEEQASVLMDTCDQVDEIDPNNLLGGQLLAIKALAKMGYDVAESAMEGPGHG